MAAAGLPGEAPSWAPAWEAAQSELAALAATAAGAPVPLRVLRVSQLDADRLDQELVELLREEVAKAVAPLRPGALAAHQPEVLLALEAVVFFFTTWRNRPTPGMALLNLRLRDEASVRAGGGRHGLGGEGLRRSQRVALAALTVGGRWAWLRLGRLAATANWRGEPPGSWRLRAWAAMHRLETAWSIASLANLLAFLAYGTYRSLPERIVRARAVYAEPVMSRVISFDYMNRQLVWNELSELTLFVLPLLNTPRLRRTVARMLGGVLPSTVPPAGAGGLAESRGWCPECHARPMSLPHVALPCTHEYCYYCLRARCEAEPSFRCLVCDERVVAMKPLPPLPPRVE